MLHGKRDFEDIIKIINLKIGRFSWNIQIGPALKIRTGRQKSLSERCSRKRQNRIMAAWEGFKAPLLVLRSRGYEPGLQGCLQELRAAFSWQLEGNRDLSPTTTWNWILLTIQISLGTHSTPRASRWEHRSADILISALWDLQQRKQPNHSGTRPLAYRLQENKFGLF